MTTGRRRGLDLLPVPQAPSQYHAGWARRVSEIIDINGRNIAANFEALGRAQTDYATTGAIPLLSYRFDGTEDADLRLTTLARTVLLYPPAIPASNTLTVHLPPAVPDNYVLRIGVVPGWPSQAGLTLTAPNQRTIRGGLLRPDTLNDMNTIIHTVMYNAEENEYVIAT